MTAVRQNEAARLRQCRQIFETSIREGIPMSAARQRVAELRWEDADRRLAARCGTRAPALATDDQDSTPPRWMMAE